MPINNKMFQQLANGPSQTYSPLPQILSDDDEDEDDTREALNKNDGLPPVLIPAGGKRRKMSFIRQACFVFSLVLAVAAVSSFLWLLPCDSGNATCQPHIFHSSTNNWKRTFRSIVFTSGLQLVDADQDGILDIILGFGTNDSSGLRGTSQGLSEAGVMVLRGRDGHQIWNQTYYSAPTEIVCGALDQNQDGVLDCILVGDHGLFSVVNVSNDNTFWYLHDHPKSLHQEAVSMPVIVSDLDGDGVQDLVVACRLRKENESMDTPTSMYLLIVSGGMGKLLGNPIPIPGCIVSYGPVAVSANASILTVVACDTDGEEGVVFASDLESLWKASRVKQNKTQEDDKYQERTSPVFVEVYRFSKQDAQIHLWATDIDADGIEDLIVAGGDRKVTALRRPTSHWNVLWSTQIGEFDVTSCHPGPLLADGSRCVVLTLTPSECREDCSTTVVVLSGRNGSEIWRYNGQSLVSPVPFTMSESWPTMISFKETTQVPNKENCSKTETLNRASNAPEEWRSNEDEAEDFVSLVQVQEKLLLLTFAPENNLQTVVLDTTNDTCCYTPTVEQLSDCLPASAARISSVIGDVDGDGLPDLVSVKTTVVCTDDGSDLAFMMIVSKTNLANRANWFPNRYVVQDMHVPAFV